MRAGPSPRTTVPRPRENGEQEVMAPMQWVDATVGGQDTTGLSLDLPCTKDPELFFAESPQDVEQAKAMCRGCRAKLACLAGAVQRREPWGVWGGELLIRGVIVPGKRPRGRPRKDAVAIGRLPPLAGLVVAGGLLSDDVHAVPCVDTRDERHQGGELVLVVVLGGVRPGLVGDAAGGVGDAGALLGQFQGGSFGLGEDRGLPSGRDQVEPHLGFPACAAGVLHA